MLILDNFSDSLYNKNMHYNSIVLFCCQQWSYFFSVWFSTKSLQINTVLISKPIQMRLDIVEGEQLTTWNNQTHEKLNKFYKTLWNLQSKLPSSFLVTWPFQKPEILFCDKKSVAEKSLICYFMTDISLLLLNLAKNLLQAFKAKELLCRLKV